MSVFIIAEAGVNHNGSVHLAKKLINVASAAGANAIKFQTFTAENLVTKNLKKAKYQKNTTSRNENQFSMLKNLELNKKMHVELINHCRNRNIKFLSTNRENIPAPVACPPNFFYKKSNDPVAKRH